MDSLCSLFPITLTSVMKSMKSLKPMVDSKESKDSMAPATSAGSFGTTNVHGTLDSLVEHIMDVIET